MPLIMSGTIMVTSVRPSGGLCFDFLLKNDEGLTKAIILFALSLVLTLVLSNIRF